MKSKYIPFSVLVTISCILYSCTSDDTASGPVIYPVDTSSFSYPFKDGNSWSYNRLLTAENIRPDSIRHYFNNYPLTGSGTIRVLYDTTVNNTVTKCFLETYSEGTGIWNSRVYYGNYDSALVCYGYRLSGGGISFPFSPAGGIKFFYGGRFYNNLREIFFSLAEFYRVPDRTLYDTMYTEDPPVKCLVYPVRTNTEWFFKNVPELSEIRKKYLNFENHVINNRMISCIKTQRIWVSMNEDLLLYDYHSKYGQMKRDYLVKNIRVMNEIGVTLGYFDSREVVTVTFFSIVP